MSMYDKLRRDIRISKGYTDSNSWVPDWACGMKKVLYVNGCSHTHGTETAMDGRLDLTWPNLLTNYLNYELINDSKKGASNDHIFRTTIEHILSSAIPPDKVVIQFTEPERLEINGKKLNPRALASNTKFDYFIKEYFPQLEPPNIEFSNKLLNQIYTLEILLKEHGVDDYFFLIWRSVNTKYITYKFINKNKMVFDVSHKLSQKYKVSQKIDPKTNLPDYHFGRDAHYELFEWVKINKSWEGELKNPDEWYNHIY